VGHCATSQPRSHVDASALFREKHVLSDVSKGALLRPHLQRTAWPREVEEEADSVWLHIILLEAAYGRRRKRRAQKNEYESRLALLKRIQPSSFANSQGKIRAKTVHKYISPDSAGSTQKYAMCSCMMHSWDVQACSALHDAQLRRASVQRVCVTHSCDVQASSASA